MNQPRYFTDEESKNLIEVICSEPGAGFYCSGKELKEVEVNTSEGAAEKHLPLVTQDWSQVTVSVGSVFHPMTEAHSIQFICLVTERGLQRVELQPDAEPKACFALAKGDRPVAAYAYCNLHGLWKTEI